MWNPANLGAGLSGWLSFPGWLPRGHRVQGGCVGALLTIIAPVIKALHIATSLRIVRKHRNTRSIEVAGARDVIKRAALAAAHESETKAERAMREELEGATGISIAQLAAIAEYWPDVD